MPKSIASALVKAQATVKPVEKDSTNSFHKYKYASSDDVVAVGREALVGAGLALARVGWSHTPLTEHEPARINVQYMLTSSDGECWMCPLASVPVLPEKGRPEDKAEAAALTYSHGYMVLGLLQMERRDEGAVDQRDDRDRGSYQRPAGRHQSPQQATVQSDRAQRDAPVSLDTILEADDLLAYARMRKPEWSALKNGQRKNAVDKITTTAERVGANAREVLATGGLG